jgi:hypothetical protein
MTTSLLTQTRALTALRQSPIPALRKLAVEETDGTIVLLGSVASYYQKQLAQETVMPFVDGRELHNRVMVIRTDRAVANSR